MNNFFTFFLLILFIFFYVYKHLPECVSKRHAHVVPTDARRGCWILGSGPKDGCKLTCACWELNPGFSGRQASALTTEQSLWPRFPVSIIAILKSYKSSRFVIGKTLCFPMS